MTEYKIQISNIAESYRVNKNTTVLSRPVTRISFLVYKRTEGGYELYASCLCKCETYPQFDYTYTNSTVPSHPSQKPLPEYIKRRLKLYTFAIDTLWGEQSKYD
jgi:hypothetical protein